MSSEDEDQGSEEEEEEELSTLGDIKEHGSDGHLPIHPDEVSATLAGGQQTVKVFTLSERVGEDDPSVSKESSSESESSSKSSNSSTSSESAEGDQSEEEEGEELPPLVRIADEEGDPLH
jgi:hypothetical protein